MSNVLEKIGRVLMRREAGEAKELNAKLRALLEATVAFALAGLALEWLHDGLVTDVVPWSAVAAVALALTAAMAWNAAELRPNPHAVSRVRVGTIALVIAALSAAAAYAYFTEIPRLRPILAASVAIIALLGAVVLTGEEKPGHA